MSKRPYEDGPGAGASPIVAGARRAQEAPFVKDIEINNIRNRYLLTKDEAQAQLMKESGATIRTMGVYIPDTTVPSRDAPLYLHITAQTQHSLDKAADAINRIIRQDLGPLTHRPGMGEQERPQRRKWPEEKVPIGLETLRNFNVRAKIGLFVKYIQQETGARVQIKGLGSGFVEHETGREADEPMHINIVGPDEAQVARGKQLAEDLLMVVREKWNEAQMPSGYQNAYNQAYGSQYYQGQSAAPLPSEAAPLPPGAPPAAPEQDPEALKKQQEEYMAQINANPEYAAYYKKLQEYYASQGQAVPTGAAPLPAGSAPAPPPPASAAPPPPPDERREGRGQYGAVKPPTGL